MRLDLRLVAHAGGAEAEAGHRPRQVGGPVGLAQREPLAQRRLVDLDHADARRLQVDDLVADRERDLTAALRAGLIVAHEGPVEDRHRPGEHALHRAIGQRLRVLGPGDGHRLRPGDVAVDDRRLHVPGAVRLHPAEAREGEAVELLAEVLDHVVALRLAVHQHVEADLLLQPDDALDLPSHRLLVAGLVQLPGSQLPAGAAQLGRLREGADRRRGEEWQREPGALHLAALLDTAGAAVVGLGGRGDALPHRGVVRARGGASRLQRGGVRPQALRDALRLAVVDGARQRRDLVDLLVREGEPREQLAVQPVLALQLDRRVHQRARGGDSEAIGAHHVAQLAEQRERRIEVVDPHVAPVHHAGEEVLAAAEPVLAYALEVAPAAHEVEADAVDGEFGERVVGLVHVAEVGLEQQLRAALDRRQSLVGGAQRLQLARRAVEHEHRLVELHPLRPCRRELRQHLLVDGEQRREQREAVELVVALALGRGDLAEQQVGQRPDQHRNRLDAGLPGLQVLVERLRRGEGEALIGGELRDDVVVVRVEPLRHLHGGDVQPVPLRPARHREVAVDVDLLAVPLVTLGNGADHRGDVEHLVVEGEGVAGDQLDPGVAHAPPGLQPQRAGRLLQLRERAPAVPVALGGALQLASRADARVAGDR